jgi:hypothetical protein
MGVAMAKEPMQKVKQGRPELPGGPSSSGPAKGRPDSLRDRDAICFSHDWTGAPLSKAQLMGLLARKSGVLWVNSIGYQASSIAKADVGRAFKRPAAFATPIREVEKNTL